MKRLAVLVVTLMLFAAFLGGCTTPTPAPTAAPTSAAATEAPTPAPTQGENINGLQLPISTTGETVSVMMTTGVSDVDFSNSASVPVFAAIAAKTGLTLKVNAMSSDNYGNVLLPLLASGQNLPDTFIMGGADLVSMGKAGTIVDLKDMMAKDCPNTTALLDKYPLIKGAIIAPEGQIWGFPNRVATGDDQNEALIPGYRLDWVQKLVSEGKLTMSAAEPQTIDDWHAMLTAFLNDDPNGNGKADEVPFSVWSFNQLYSFAQAYGMSGMLSQWFTADKNGAITYDWTNPSGHAREWVTLMNQWFKEKLLDQSMLVDHYDAAQAQLVGNIAGAETTWTGTFASMTTQMKSNGFPDANWMVAIPPKGPYGDQKVENYSYVNGERWMISKGAKDPDAILKLFDYLFATPEGQTLNNFGIEGKTYSVDNGTPTYIKSAIVEDHYKDPGTYMASQGASMITDFVMPEAENQISALSFAPDLIKRMQDLQPYIQYKFPDVTATTAESVALKAMNDINTTVNEYLQKFVTGSLEINDANWTEFQKKLTDEGVNDMIKIKQDQYDRFYGK